MGASIEILDFVGQQKLDLSRLDRLYTPRMDIGDWVLTSRKDAGLTQTELGERLGVGKANVSAWEKNRHEPSYSQILKIAEVTGHRHPLPGSRGDDWPFPSVPRERFEQLTASQRKGIEEAVKRLVDTFLGEAPGKSEGIEHAA